MDILLDDKACQDARREDFMTDMRFHMGKGKASGPPEGLIPNPKLELLEQVSEVMRFKHYSLRTNSEY